LHIFKRMYNGLWGKLIFGKLNGIFELAGTNPEMCTGCWYKYISVVWRKMGEVRVILYITIKDFVDVEHKKNSGVTLHRVINIHCCWIYPMCDSKRCWAPGYR
jgi:hypothetical protein